MRTIATCAIAAALAFAGPAHAQRSDADLPSKKAEEGAAAFFTALDANKDGKLTRAEAKAAYKDLPAEAQKRLEADFGGFDENRDGLVTKAEFEEGVQRTLAEAAKRGKRSGDAKSG